MNVRPQAELTFEEIVIRLPKLLEQILHSPKYHYGSLSQKGIEQLFNKEDKYLKGVYLFSDSVGNYLYVGLSKTMGQRVGTDHKKKDANFLNRLIVQTGFTAAEVKAHMLEDFNVQMIEIENEYTRKLFEVYVMMKLNTPFNSENIK